MLVVSIQSKAFIGVSYACGKLNRTFVVVTSLASSGLYRIAAQSWCFLLSWGEKSSAQM